MSAATTALRRRLEKLAATQPGNSKDLAHALLIINESLQDLANRVIALEKVVAHEKRKSR